MEAITKFCETLYPHFRQRVDSIMNLLDAITSHGYEARSVCLASVKPIVLNANTVASRMPLAMVCRRLIGRVYKRIYLNKTWFNSSAGAPPCSRVDCTPNPGPVAKTFSDKVITHAPNPAPGNKPICVAHAYSCVELLPTDQ